MLRLSSSQQHSRFIARQHLLRPGGELARVSAQHLLLHSQDLRGVHGEAAQPQAQQQPRHGHIARRFAAHTHAFALALALSDHIAHQAEHGGVQRVVQVRHSLVSTVDGQGVLDQVVGCLLYTSDAADE
mgnify:CR=1 FL=1